MSTNLFIKFFWIANVFLPFVVLHSIRELRFLAMGGSISFWSLSIVHRLPRGHRHLQPEAGADRGTGFSRSMTIDAANVRPAPVNATRRTAPSERLVSCTFITSTPTWVLLHDVTTLRRLYAFLDGRPSGPALIKKQELDYGYQLYKTRPTG
jgi:hypothetical protein